MFLYMLPVRCWVWIIVEPVFATISNRIHYRVKYYCMLKIEETYMVAKYCGCFHSGGGGIIETIPTSYRPKPSVKLMHLPQSWNSSQVGRNTGTRIASGYLS